MDVWPFLCQFPGCGRKFKRKDVFKNHQRTHAKDFDSSLVYSSSSGLNVASSVTSLSSPGSSPGMTSTNATSRHTTAVLEEQTESEEGREEDDNNEEEHLQTDFDARRGERITSNPDKLSSMNQEDLSVQRKDTRRTRSSTNVIDILLTSPSFKANQNNIRQLRSLRSSPKRISFASKNQVVIEQDDDDELNDETADDVYQIDRDDHDSPNGE
jgi:hypothetical protein